MDDPDTASNNSSPSSDSAPPLDNPPASLDDSSSLDDSVPPTDEAASTEAPTPPTDEPPAEDIPAPSEGVPAPSEDVPAPSEDVPAPSEDVPAPSEGVPAPSEDVPAPSEDVPAPSEDVPAPSEGEPAPSEGVPAPSEGVPAPSEDEPPPDGYLILPSSGTSLLDEPHEEHATGTSQVHWDESVTDGPPAEETLEPSGDATPPPALSDDLAALADPLVYDATHAAVSAVLGRAVDLLQRGALPQLLVSPGALSAAAALLQHVVTAARQHVETAAAAVHRLLPLGVRLAEHVMTVPEWRSVEARSRRCAQRVIYQALLELELPPAAQEARRLLRCVRRRPAQLWADLTLDEAAEALGSRRPPDRYPGYDADLDAAEEAEQALLRAYRAAARAQLTEPVPAVRLPPAAALDRPDCVAAVHEVVKSWHYAVRWRYCVDFLRFQEERLLSRHVYQVRFSIPEHHQPIPRAVAYVFFVLTVSNVKPASEPIQMYYMMETSRLRHVPGKSIFQEKWLIDIVNVKLKFWREIKF